MIDIGVAVMIGLIYGGNSVIEPRVEPQRRFERYELIFFLCRKNQNLRRGLLENNLYLFSYLTVLLIICYLKKIVVGLF